MISNRDRTLIMSDYARDGSFVCYQPQTRTIQIIPYAGVVSPSLYLGSNDYFAAIPIYDEPGEHSQITAHNFRNPAEVISVIRYGVQGRNNIEGDASVWSYLPKAYLVDSADIVRVFPERGTFKYDCMHWFFDPAYDRDYESLRCVKEIPGSNHLIFTINRNSHLVIYDPDEGRVVSRIVLNEHGGAPDIKFRKLASEAWGSDIQSLYPIKLPEWDIQKKIQIEHPIEPEPNYSYMPSIGDYCFSPDETVVMVTRPERGDVLGVDTTKRKVMMQTQVDGHPVGIVALDSRRFVITGDLKDEFVQGSLKDIRQ